MADLVVRRRKQTLSIIHYGLAWSLLFELAAPRTAISPVVHGVLIMAWSVPIIQPGESAIVK
jgi:hypothetical protein